jgi:UDP-hydrolysing UDP-N-acetyl-D-glucosamine 2-epimerase
VNSEDDRRRICFVTGTRAEYGLMRRTLAEIRRRRHLLLQVVATGMHLDPTHGRTVDQIRDDGFAIDAEVPWPTSGDAFGYAAAVGTASAGLAGAFADLRPDVVLVVGDRVEAFAAAAAGHLAGLLVAHVHGGDRATGQADDALRHAITKLAHLHLPATPGSRDRILRLGEQPDRVVLCGTPGLDGIGQDAGVQSLADGPFCLLVLHPTDADEAAEFERADTLLQAVLDAGVPRVVIVHPNNDPGSAGIIRRWAQVDDARALVRRDVPRETFLGLLRDASLLVGNSSAGIIESGSFGLPVLDVGPRQTGRERGRHVRHCDWADVGVGVAEAWSATSQVSRERPSPGDPYQGDGAAARIADALEQLDPTPAFRRKLIAY